MICVLSVTVLFGKLFEVVLKLTAFEICLQSLWIQYPFSQWQLYASSSLLEIAILYLYWLCAISAFHIAMARNYT